MIPQPGKPRYTPSDETPKGTASDHERWKRLALEGRYGHLLRELSESGRFGGEEIETLTQTYRSLKQYYAEGADDPEREKYHRNIGKRLLSLIRKDEEAQLILRDPHHLRTDLLKSLGTRGISALSLGEMVSEIKLRQRRDEVFYNLLEDLFNRLWTTLELPEEAGDALAPLIETSELKEAGWAVVGGLFVGVMEFFDPVKMRILLRASTQRGAMETRSAAVPALLFAARRHQEELLRLYPELVAEAKVIIGGDEELKQLIFLCILDSHIAYDTKEDHRIFLQEILPTIKNVQSMLGEVPGKDLAERMKNLSLSMDENDESQAELRRMMEKAVSRLGSEDFRTHDLEYHNAVHMKMHPFFLKPINWFLLFDPSHPALSEDNVRTMERLTPIVFQGRQIISSDLYSYGLLVDWRPIAGQIEQMGQELPTEIVLYERDPRSVMREYIFGAYRFYHLFIAKDRFHNPFTAMPYLLDGAFTQIPMLYDEEAYLRLAGHLGGQKHYISAGYTYARLVEEWGHDSAEAWRGLAVANIRIGLKLDALYCIDKAIGEEGLTAVTASNKAGLLWDLGRRGEAVVFLEKAEGEVPEEETYELAIRRARMLRDLGRNEEAVTVAFKADYLEEELPGKSEARELLIRILLKEGRAAEALSKAEHLDSKPYYRGIALLASGQRKEGLRALKVWATKDRHGAHKEALSALLPLLTRYGIPEWEQSLIYDAILPEPE